MRLCTFLPGRRLLPGARAVGGGPPGFVKAPESPEDAPLYLVDMHAPLVLVQNLETTLKEPFSSNPRVLDAIYKAHRELQMAMTRFYPGQLVLSMSASVIYHRLVERITALNGVPRDR